MKFDEMAFPDSSFSQKVVFTAIWLALYWTGLHFAFGRGGGESFMERLPVSLPIAVGATVATSVIFFFFRFLWGVAMREFGEKDRFWIGCGLCVSVLLFLLTYSDITRWVFKSIWVVIFTSVVMNAILTFFGFLWEAGKKQLLRIF